MNGKLEKKTWLEVKEKIYETDPQLAIIINQLKLDEQYCFYVATYPYGALIVDRGKFQIPNSDANIVPFDDMTIPEEVRKELSYNKMVPTGIVTNNSIETFFNTETNTIPVSLYGVGDWLALWHVMEGRDTYQTGPVWSISSGARTICMLPKISDKQSYQKLKTKYDLKTIPRMPKEHWDTFVTLSRHANFPEKWHAEIIFFSKKWFSDLSSTKLSPLFSYLLTGIWQSSSFRRNQFITDYAFSVAQQNSNLKPNPYLADTAKHLYAIGDGSVPGLAPAINSKAAPIEGLQKIFLEDYGIKHAPIIIHPYHFNAGEKRTAYYSLGMPTTTTFSPKSAKTNSKMVDLKELKNIAETLQSEIIKGTLLVQDTPLLNLAKKIRFDFYHANHDKQGEIQHASALKNTDTNFNKLMCGSAGYEFPEFSQFFKGCISISEVT